MRQFAEQELILPSGPYQDEQFRINRLPWQGLWFDAVDSGHWRRFVMSGVGQGGKTLAGSGVPIMYHLFEHRETAIYAAPTLEMAADKWRQDVLPLIASSRYRDFLPDGGAGSRGGTPNAIQFKHGPTLKFMTGGGSDKVRAGFTSRVVIITETDGLDDAGESSRETDKINQLEARTSAFGDRARTYMECTVSTEEGRTWKEMKAGTDSRLILLCPHCDKRVTPEREHLTGWHDAKNVIEARDSARLACPSCGCEWSEDDRLKANISAMLIHRGQEVDEAGSLVGMMPKTLTLGFRFTAVNNMLVPMKRVAEEEWGAPRTTDPDLAERKLRQFYWTLPSEPDAVTTSEIDAAAITSRIVDIPRGRVPADAAKLTVGIDVGKWLCHWVAPAWRGGSPHVVEYGRLEVPSASMAEELAILTALRRFRDEVALIGWPSVGGGQNIRPSLVLVDSGNWESTVVAFCKESGPGYLPCKGFGVAQLGRRKIAREPGYEVVEQSAGHNLIEINADHWKTEVHNRLQTPINQPGALTLFNAKPVEHLSFAKHLTAEKRVEEFIAGRGTVIRWEAMNRNNHYLDALSLACVAGHGVGERLLSGPVQQKPQSIAPAVEAKQSNPVTSYKGRW